MGIQHNQTGVTPTDRLSTPTPQATGQLRRHRMRRRYVSEIMVAFLFLSAVAVYSSLNHAVATHPSNSQSSDTHNTTTQTLQAESAPAPDSGATSTTNTQEDSAMQSTNENSVDAQVTVNGQSIDVPENGTTEQTVTSGDGNTSVTISNNQTTTGDARGNSRTSSHLHVSTTTRSNDSVTGSWSNTP